MTQKQNFTQINTYTSGIETNIFLEIISEFKFEISLVLISSIILSTFVMFPCDDYGNIMRITGSPPIMFVASPKLLVHLKHSKFQIYYNLLKYPTNV